MEIRNPAGEAAVSSKRRRRRRGKKKATSQIVDRMDVDLDASKIRGDCEIANNNEIQSMDQPNCMSNIRLTDKNLGQEIDDGITENEGGHSANQNKMDIKSTVSLTAGHVNTKRKQKRKKVKSKARNDDEVKSGDMQLLNKSLRQEIANNLAKNEGGHSTNQNKMDIKSTVSLTEGHVNAKRKRKRKKVKSKARNDDEVKSGDMQLLNKSLRQEIANNLAKNDGVRHTNQDMIDIDTVNLTEGNVNQNMGQSHSMSKLQLSETNFRQEVCDKLSENVDFQHTDQEKVDIESTVNLTEGDVSRRMKKIKRKTGNENEFQSMDQSNVVSNLQSNNNLRKEVDNKLTEDEEVRSTDQKMMDIGLPYNVAEVDVNTKKRRKKAKSKNKNKDEVQSMDQVNGISNIQLSENKLVENDPTAQESNLKEAEFLSKDLGEYPSRSPTTTYRRKLLVLDVNGLLAYIVMPPPKDRKSDINILRRAVFKRPFCDDFLKFCFQNFDVGIWSSRAKEVINRIVDYLLGNLKQKLLFCWNMSDSTQTGFRTLENTHKPLVFKELRKIWEHDDCKFSWKKGQYNEFNTLLIDDSPYKALLNPLYTAIYPHSYHYADKDDYSLGPGGDIRVYLEGLLKSENVQEYVRHHPFGQNAINETNVSWQFYSRVLQNFSVKIQASEVPTPMLDSTHPYCSTTGQSGGSQT